MTSEGGEGSVLFSEQAAAPENDGVFLCGERFIPDVDTEGRELSTGGGEFLPEEEADAEEDGEEGEHRDGDVDGEEHEEKGEEDPHGHEESQDRNEIVEDDEDGAESPAWLKEPHTLTSTVFPGPSRTSQLDRMSRFLKVPSKIIRSLGSNHTNGSGIPADNGERLKYDEPPPTPSCYHSGDSDDYAMDHRHILERTEIKRDIREFVESLGSEFIEWRSGMYRYKVVDRLGEGMYSLSR